jgi:hypothetical protein
MWTWEEMAMIPASQGRMGRSVCHATNWPGRPPCPLNANRIARQSRAQSHTPASSANKELSENHLNRPVEPEIRNSKHEIRNPNRASNFSVQSFNVFLDSA